MPLPITSFSLSGSSDELQNSISELKPGYVNVSHPESGDRNLIRVAYHDDHARGILSTLANNRFYLYQHAEGQSQFVRADVIPQCWGQVADGKLLVNEDNLVYSYTPPKVGSLETKLLVIFSSIYSSIFASGLDRHFTENFPKARAYMTPETGILRIADFGGVVGGFYLPTTADPEAGKKVQRLIDDVASRHGIKRDAITLYGASKGATAAVYHGMTGNFRFVAVDPIVSDEHYETKYRDSHFTGSGIFPISKQALFANIVEEALTTGSASNGHGRWVVICSERSPQYKYIDEILIQKMKSNMFFLNSLHPDITDHPHVAPKTMTWAIMFLNMSLNAFPIEAGLKAAM